MQQTRSPSLLKEVAVVTRNPLLGRALAETLRRGGAHLHMVAERLKDGLLPSPLPQLAILDVDLADPAECHELEALLRSLGGQVAFVVTSASPTVEGMRILLRHGIVDLLPQPLVAEDLARAMDAALNALNRRSPESDRKPASGRGVVVSLIKAGGGVGATTLATQATCAMAKGQDGPGQVCLLDLDLQFGSAAFHLDLPQRASVVDLAEAGSRLDGAMLRSAMAVHGSGLHVLAAPPAIHPLEGISLDLATQLVALARTQYRLVVVDHPVCWTGWTGAVLAESDRILLVVQPSVPSMRHAKRQLETLREEGLDQIPLQVVVNRVRRGLFRADGPSTKDMETAIGCRPTHRFTEDDDMERAVNQGKSLAELGAARSAKGLLALFEGLALPVPA